MFRNLSLVTFILQQAIFRGGHLQKTSPLLLIRLCPFPFFFFLSWLLVCRNLRSHAVCAFWMEPPMGWT